MFEGRFDSHIRNTIEEQYPDLPEDKKKEVIEETKSHLFKVSGENRRILGKETITTKSMMMKDVETIKSWYAYDIGLVKEITYDKNGKLLSSMILNEICRL